MILGDPIQSTKEIALVPVFILTSVGKWEFVLLVEKAGCFTPEPLTTTWNIAGFQTEVTYGCTKSYTVMSFHSTEVDINSYILAAVLSSDVVIGNDIVINSEGLMPVFKEFIGL